MSFLRMMLRLWTMLMIESDLVPAHMGGWDWHDYFMVRVLDGVTLAFFLPFLAFVLRELEMI